MNNFKKQFKQGDDYCDIRADYRSLISIGKSVEETEDLLQKLVGKARKGFFDSLTPAAQSSGGFRACMRPCPGV